MTFYEDMAALAEEMLAEFGAPGVLVRSGPSSTTFDKRQNRNVTTGGAPVQVPVTASVGPIAIKDAEGREVTKSAAVMREKPVQGDKLQWGELTYTVGTVTAVPLQGQIVCYIAEVA